MKTRIKIYLSGGGTLGSVIPLLGLVDEIKKDQTFQAEILFVGTKKGIESEVIKKEGIRYVGISSGKLRRYFSWQNFFDVVFVFQAFFESLFLFLRERPDIVVSAGSFVSVPFVWAAWLLGIPVLIHQQDARPGLANKLMSPFATRITCTFRESVEKYGGRAICVGNSIRIGFKDYKVNKREALQKLNLNPKKFTILILGGGTGADAINKIFFRESSQILKTYQVIHLCGKNKITKELADLSTENASYQVFEFLNTEGMIKAYRSADLVISRCGMGVLTELCYLGKLSILIPIPDSHQEDNAQVFVDNKAAVVLSQKNIKENTLSTTINQIVKDPQKQESLKANIRNVISANATYKILNIIKKII